MNGRTSFFVANAAQLGLRFGQMILVTRTLSAVDLGVYYVTAAYPQFLSRVFDLGLPHATRYYLLRFPNQVSYLVKMVTVSAAMVFPLIAITFYLIAHLPLEGDEFSAQLSQSWLLLSFYCLLVMVNSILNSLLLSVEKYSPIVLAFTLPYIVFIAAVSVEAFLGPVSAGAVLLQLTISEVIIFLIYGIFVFRMMGGAAPREYGFGWSDVMAYAIRIYPNGFLKAMSARLDRVVLSFIASPVFIGQYSVLVTLRDIAIIPVTTYGQTFMNELTARRKSNITSVRKFVDRNLLWIAIIYAGGVGVFIALRDLMLSIFFKQIDNDLRVLSMILSISVIPTVLLAFIHSYFLATNRPQHISLSSALLMLSFYGFIGVGSGVLGSQAFAYASLSSAFVAFGYLLVLYWRFEGSNNLKGLGN
jgi:O-antigen/teichoic acid export membrane protein